MKSVFKSERPYLTFSLIFYFPFLFRCIYIFYLNISNWRESDVRMPSDRYHMKYFTWYIKIIGVVVFSGWRAE